MNEELTVNDRLLTEEEMTEIVLKAWQGKLETYCWGIADAVQVKILKAVGEWLEKIVLIPSDFATRQTWRMIMIEHIEILKRGEMPE